MKDNWGNKWPDTLNVAEDAKRPSTTTGYVAVPISELKKLEECRVDIYKHLEGHVGVVMLQNITNQIWKVANRKKWD